MSELTFSNPKSGQARTPPGPKGHLVLGVSHEFQGDSLGYMLAMMHKYGDAVRFRFFLNLYGYMFSHPDYNKHILQDNNRNYSKGHISFLLLRPLVGNGLLTSDGDFWRRQRRLIQPAFHHRRIAGFSAIMTEAAQALLQRWQPWIEGGQVIDVDREMTRLTFQIVGRSLFGVDLSGDAERVSRSFTYANQYIAEMTSRPFSPLLIRLPSSGNRRLRAAIQELDEVVYKIIDERRRHGQESDDLLSMLMSARDEDTGEAMEDAQLRDEVMTLMLAGHETTANALTWTWYLLSQHPSVEAKLHEELRRVLAGRSPTIEDLPGLKYTRMVIEEAMRLYPPAYALGRLSVAEDRVGDYHLPAGSTLMLSPYLTHRHPDFWPDPEKFDPERFNPDRPIDRPRYAYLPFGGGPRQCIGNSFAMTEAQLVLATMAQHTRLSLVPGHPVEVEPLITLRPKYGMKMIAV